MESIRYASTSFPAAAARGGLICVGCDNMVVVSILNTMMSRSPQLNAELWLIEALQRCKNCRLEASWIRTAMNVWANNISRHNDSTDWQLHHGIFLQLNTLCGPCHVDRFATAGNTQLRRLISLMRHSNAEAVDGWAQWWGGSTVNYVDPPFSQAGLVIRKIVEDKVSAVVVL